MECLQHERVRIFQNKTSIERQSFMRTCKLDTGLITRGGSSQCSLYHGELNYEGDESSSFVIA